MIVIFIAGASASGKTTLAKKLVDKLESEGVSSNSFTMDDYFKEIPEGVDLEYFRNNTNFDQPSMYDFDLFAEHLRQLSNGEKIIKPIFDFPTNKRLTYETIKPKELLIIDGLFALNFAKQLEPNIQRITVYVNGNSYLDLIKRRVMRDVTERNRTVGDVIKQERRFVGPAFFNVIAKSQSGVDINILNTPQGGKPQHPLDEAVYEVLEHLNSQVHLNQLN